MRISQLILATIFLFSSLASAAWAEDAGKVRLLQGQAAASGPEGSRALGPGAGFALNEHLTTGPDSRLMAVLADGSELTLGANADFTVDEMVLDQNHPSALFHLAKGAFRMVGGAIARMPGHRMEIASPLGTIGIRGTDVWGGSLKSPFDVFLIEGQVDVTTPGGTVVLNQPGQGTSVMAPGQPPLPPVMWNPALRDRAFATVSFGPR